MELLVSFRIGESSAKIINSNHSRLTKLFIDVHLELEEAIAKFLNLEETALYAYAFAAISSAIPSYAKRGDVIFA